MFVEIYGYFNKNLIKIMYTTALHNRSNNNWVKEYDVVFMTIIVIIWILNEQLKTLTPPRYKEPSLFKDLTRKWYMDHILRSIKDYYVSYLNMDVGPFMHLVLIMHDRHILHDTRQLSIEE